VRRSIVLAIAAASTLAAVFLSPAGAAHAEGSLSSLTISPSVLNNGASAVGTIILAPDPNAPTTIHLLSLAPEAAQVPDTVVAGAGQSTVTFTVTTSADAPETGVQIWAFVGNIIRSYNITVNPAPPAGPSLSSVSVTPASMTGGSPATGTVQFNGTPDAAVVQLSSSDPSVLQVPATALVPRGRSSGAFAVTTSPVTATTTATITANWFGIIRTTTVTITPGAPAPADVVRITRATNNKRLVRIEATSSNPNAILSVFIGGSFAYNLTNQGGGKYSDERGFVTPPTVIEVRSNLGGSATATVRS
jgi:hypothetical protein